MSSRNTVVRSLHDLGAAAWFGGSLMGAVGVNGAAGAVRDPQDRARVASVGWAKWAPVNAAAIGAHLIGGGLLLYANRDRAKHQSGGLCPSGGVKEFGRRFPRRRASLKEGTHVRVEEDIACAAVAGRD